MKNIDVIRRSREDDLIEILYEKAFDCDERCPDFGCGCMEKCMHDCGRDFIRDWLNSVISPELWEPEKQGIDWKDHYMGRFEKVE